jgi:hypothetical protein
MKHFLIPALLPLLVIACTSSGTNDSDPDGSGGDPNTTTGGSGSGGESSSGGANNTGGMGGDSSMGGDVGTGGSDTGGTLEACFANLRETVGSFQDATKASPDGDYTVRLALETGDGFGTSGTKAWYAFRLGIETPEGTICVTDEVALKEGYTGSHHNCGDVLEVTVDDVRYVIENPDSAADYVDPETWRRPGELTIYENDVQVGEPIRLDTVSCNDTSEGDDLCRSGGPC